ncbi:P-loop containing nucleoside triphosphate hydrolase protein [Peziza echinospora]|nr:P-loop containing nucleoside triphosphate hydrolase protein [Peziza echinospora]
MAAMQMSKCGKASSKRFGIVITPIEALGKDQIIAEILKYTYNLIYVSPENLLQRSSPFQKLMFKGSSTLDNKVGFMVVDESHLVVNWGNEFRMDFSPLNTLRPVLGRVPFGACTITATFQKLELIHKGLGIAKSAISIVEPTNRINLFLAVKEIIGGMGPIGSGDLDFLVPRATGTQNRDPQHDNRDEFGLPIHYNQMDIPLTIIYADCKQLYHSITDYLHSLLQASTKIRPELRGHWDKDPRSRAKKIITIYHSSLSPTMKKLTQTHWRDGTTRILVATSAWGMGINDKKIQIVTQWRVKIENLDTLIQHFRRAGREPTLQAVCILFAEKDVF